MRIDSLTSTVVLPDTKSSSTARAQSPVVEVAERSTEPEAKQFVTEIVAAAKQIEAYLERAGRALEFRVDAETNRTVVTVRDTLSGEVIRQIPGDEVLHLARQLAAGSGGLVDLKV